MSEEPGTASLGADQSTPAIPAMPAMPGLLFDRIIVRQEPVQAYSVDEFLRLPLHERIRYLLHKNVEFYSGRDLVNRKDALASLRSARVSTVATDGDDGK